MQSAGKIIKDSLESCQGALLTRRVAPAHLCNPRKTNGLSEKHDVIDPLRLKIQAYGNLMMIFWPADPSGFVLETTSSLSPGTWIAVPDSPVQIGDQLLVPVEMSEGDRFYRLRFSRP